ncbi:MAG: AmmeMemoRadiSam system radical SAM enzyme [Epsilonproteobacteria bacterium]|nr:AmmeMemoRadiSam system radical SAM enzyme [Campylobacterota bacterium]
MSSHAWLSHSLTDGRIECDACYHRCKLHEGAYGICGVRRVENGQLRLLVYAKAAAAHIDPIEKKPLFHFLPHSRVFSFGTVGCNFSCQFCQNHEISQYPKTKEHRIFGETLTPEMIVTLALKQGCQSIAYTYNEPAVFFEYTYDTAKLAHEAGLKNIYVTSGYETPKAIETIAPFLDAMNIDIKAFSQNFYHKICGASLQPVLDTLAYAHQKGIWIETTTLIIPTLNDSDKELREIATFQATLDDAMPWHISAFHPTYKMLHLPPTPHDTLKRAHAIGKEAGLKYVYVGNVDDASHESTYCPQCHNGVISRHGHLGECVTNHLMCSGACPHCGYIIKGIWR